MVRISSGAQIDPPPPTSKDETAHLDMVATWILLKSEKGERGWLRAAFPTSSRDATEVRVIAAFFFFFFSLLAF